MNLRYLKTIGKRLNLDFGQLGHRSKAQRFAMKELVPNTKKPREKALDVGCGDGHATMEMKKKGYYVVQMDKEKPYERNSDGHLVCKYAKGNFFGVNIEKGLPFGDNTFDIVWSSDVIEHLDDYEFTVKEMERVTKPLGRIVITTPNRDFWLRRLLKLVGLLGKIESGDHVYILNDMDFYRREYVVMRSGMLSPSLVAFKDKVKEYPGVK